MNGNGNGKKDNSRRLSPPLDSVSVANRFFFSRQLAHDFAPRTKERDLLNGPPYICVICGRRLSQKDEERVDFIRANPALGFLYRAVCSTHSVALNESEYHLMLSTIEQLGQELVAQATEKERRARVEMNAPLRNYVPRKRLLV